MAYEGYLLKVINPNNSAQKTLIPNKYFMFESYSCTPNQIIDLDSTRSEQGILYRNALAHTSTKIEIKTKPMTNAEWNSLWTIISNGFTNPQERRIGLEFYNTMTNSYDSCPVATNSGTYGFYIPDFEMPIRNVDDTNNIVNYKEITLKFIGY